MKTTTIRLPDDLHKQIRRQALENDEAMNTWILRALENTINQEGKAMKISITENGIWAGTGILRDGYIEDCATVLGDDRDMADHAFDAIEEAIIDDETSVTTREPI